MGIIPSSYYIHGPWRDKNVFAVLYASIMGITRCYKTIVFYIYICSFSTKFILQSERSRKSNCVTVPNFVEIARTAAKIWRFFDFSRWRPPSTCTHNASLLALRLIRRSICTTAGFILLLQKSPGSHAWGRRPHIFLAVRAIAPSPHRVGA